MASPLKPWEKQNVNNLFDEFNKYIAPGTNNNFNQSNFTNQSSNPASLSTATTNPANAPPVPARPAGYGTSSMMSRYNNMTYNPHYSSYGSPYTSSLFSPYGGAGYGYGFGGGFGMNRYSPYGGYPSNNGENDFLRVAEESCGHAFQSLESIVQSVASVSMMLESTYFAIHSSFRAVLAVAHHLSTLKEHFSNVGDQIPVIRVLLAFIRKILHFIGLATNNHCDIESAWRQAASGRSGNTRLDSYETFKQFFNGKEVNNKSSLPILIFFGLVMGTPWMIWSILSRMNRSSARANTKWSTGEDDHYVAQTLYPFTTDAPGELAFSAGQKLIIAPKEVQPDIANWLLASIAGQTGLVPANYIKIIEFKRGVEKKNIR